jgi:NAD(P)H-hydrate repair Nnr-like enzyme with NAD(P)H-hydrate epimerase domain
MNDTIKLLKECDSGCRTAIDGMSSALTKASSPSLKSEIASCTENHAKLSKECRALLCSLGENGGEPLAIAEMMMKAGTSVKLAVMPEDKHVAKMMADGANMGIQSITKALNSFPNSSSESVDLAKRIINEEKHFYNSMLNYL